MGFLKIPLILFLIISILNTRAASHRTNKNRRNNNVDRDASNNCFCFPKSLAQAPIADIIDPNGNCLERLVVYLYRDSKSHVIKIYTPAKAKQNLLPDLPFETGDSLDPITTESVAQVFNSSPGKICLNVTNAPETKDKPEVDAVTHDFNEDKFDWIINNEIPGIESVPFAVSPLDVTNQLPIDNNYQMHSDSDAWSLIDNNLPFYYNLIEDSKVLPTEYEVHRNVEPIYPQPSVETRSQEAILNSTVYNSNRDVNSKNYVTFDKWFADQMAKFNALNGPTTANTIDVYTLKALTEKTLQENNIYVSVDGVLTDAFGNVIDFSNLMLRPILIGDLVEYQNVLKETNKFKIPTNSPYLEALLITLVNPPKVLGIIPLGLAVLPSPIIPTISDKYSDDISSTENSYWSLGKFGKYSGRRIIPGYLKVPDNSQNSNGMGQIKYSNRRASNKDLNSILRKAKAKRPEKIRVINKAPKMDNDDISDDSQKAKRTKLRGILQNFYRLAMEAKHENKDQKDNNDSYEDFLSEDEEEEKHNFRIIGGNAATSSGTPINNKGRSGLII